MSERRLHPFSFLFAIQDTARQVLLPALVALFAARTRDTWESAAVFILVPLAVIAIGRALSFRYRFDATELVIRSGFVFRRVRHIPYDRIQNINIVQGPLHRMLKVIEVRIETGGAAEVEAHLRVVDPAALEEIRSHVGARRAPAADGRDESVPEPAAVLLKLPAREVLLLGLIEGRGMVLAGAVVGLAWEIGVLEGALGAGRGRGIIRQLARGIFDDAPLPLSQIALGIGTILILLAAFRILSAVWTALKYYGFTLARAGDDLRCEYGLLTHVTLTIPVRRVQKITIHDGPWHRRAGRCSLHVQTAGGKAGTQVENQHSPLAPLIRTTELPRILEQVLPDAASAIDWQPVHPKAVRRELAGSLVVLLPLLAVAWAAFGMPALAVAPVALAWAVLYARRSAAALGWAVSSEAVYYARGWLWRTRVAAPLTKLQVISRHESPLDRRHAMASVLADTAGGRGPRENLIHVPYLARDVATDLAGRLSAAAARTPFRW